MQWGISIPQGSHQAPKSKHSESALDFTLLHCPVTRCKHSTGKGKGMRKGNLNRHMRVRHGDVCIFFLGDLKGLVETCWGRLHIFMSCVHGFHGGEISRWIH